jgi:hypothetical protein
LLRRSNVITPKLATEAALAPTSHGRYRGISEYLVAGVWSLIVAWPFIRPDRFVAGFDALAYSGPSFAVARRQWGAGHVPLWNSGSFGGAPQLGNPQAGVLYPLKVLGFGLSTNRAMGVIVFAHVMLLGLSTVWLVRAVLGRHAPAATIASVIVVGSGAVMTKTIQFEQMLVIAWLPLLLGFAFRVIERQRPRRSMMALVVVSSLALVAGHPQLVYIIAPLVAAFTVAAAIALGRPRRLVHIVVAGLAAAALASPQLLPAAQATARQADTTVARQLAARSPAYHVQAPVLAPTVFGNVRSSNPVEEAQSFEGVSFVGVAAGVLALVGWLDLRRRRSHDRVRRAMLLLGGFGIAALLLALGPATKLHGAAVRILPGYELARVPARWMVDVTMLVSLAAAQAVHALRSSRTGWRSRAAIAVAGAALAIVGLFSETQIPNGRTALIWLCLAGATAWAIGSKHFTRIAAAGLVALAVGELWMQQRHSFARTSLRAEAVGKNPTPIAGFLATRPGRSIAITNDDFDHIDYLELGLRPNTNDFFGARSLDGYDGGVMVTERWATAATALTEGYLDASQPLRGAVAMPVNTAISARLGVHYLVTDTTRSDAASAVVGWSGPVFTDGSLAVWENPAFVGEAVVRETAGATPPTAGVVESRRDGYVRVVVTEGQIRVGATVRIDEQFTPDWSVTIDGHDAKASVVDELYVGTTLGPGPHTVVFRYRPTSFFIGLAIAAVTVVAGLIAFVVAGRRDRARVAK